MGLGLELGLELGLSWSGPGLGLGWSWRCQLASLAAQQPPAPDLAMLGCPPLPTSAACQARGSCPKARPLVGRPPASSEAGGPRPPTIGWGAREGWGPVGGPPIGWDWGPGDP